MKYTAGLVIVCVLAVGGWYISRNSSSTVSKAEVEKGLGSASVLDKLYPEFFSKQKLDRSQSRAILVAILDKRITSRLRYNSTAPLIEGLDWSIGDGEIAEVQNELEAKVLEVSKDLDGSSKTKLLERVLKSGRVGKKKSQDLKKQIAYSKMQPWDWDRKFVTGQWQALLAKLDDKTKAALYKKVKEKGEVKP